MLNMMQLGGVSKKALLDISLQREHACTAESRLPTAEDLGSLLAPSPLGHGQGQKGATLLI